MYKFSDVEHSDGVTSIILSPLPIWTGYKAADPLNVLTRKNEVFIDIGSGNSKEAFEVLHGAFSMVFIGLFFIYILFVTLIEPQSGFLNINLIIILIGCLLFVFCMCVSYVVIGHIQHGKENMQTRFNRQRREVAWVDNKKQLHLVPWESFKAWVSTASTVGDSVAYRSALFGMGPPAYDDPHGFIGVWRMPCGVELSGIMQWECIRSFMELGPDHIPDVDMSQRDPKLHYQKRQALRIQGEWKSWIKHVIADWFMGRFWAFKFARLFERLESVEVCKDAIEWSKPLPEEQWAKPSAELVELEKKWRKRYKRREKFFDMERRIAEAKAEGRYYTPVNE
ncbi:hypothetical protein [Zooshikella ganghwensis]|uniref:Uncharacterized protein n=1 Tax=Zooshikella ganghwensis TaxID=202772 RepID=A0A4V1IMZ2_9GAMM|nr:hypothetical protein [Zooshikella ganghwensis]RDH41921.1 hypothetical protein B9G39_26265 [Zooshikella ganghwensis]